MNIIDNYYEKKDILNDIRMEINKYNLSGQVFDYARAMINQNLVENKGSYIEQSALLNIFNKDNAIEDVEKIPSDDKSRVLVKCEMRDLLSSIAETNQNTHEAFINCCKNDYSDNAYNKLLKMQKEKSFLLYGYREGEDINILGMKQNPITSSSKKAHLDEIAAASAICSIKKSKEINQEGRTPVLMIGSTHVYYPQNFGTYANCWNNAEFREFHKNVNALKEVGKKHNLDLEVLNLNITPSLNFNVLGFDGENKKYYKIPSVAMVKESTQELSKVESYDIYSKAVFPPTYKIKRTHFAVKTQLSDLKDNYLKSKKRKEWEKELSK